MATKQRSVCHRAQGISTGKRQGGPTVPSTTAGPPDPQLIIIDSITGRHFLVDTGAQVSVIPPTWHERHFGQRGQALQAANGTTISTFGSRSQTVHGHLLFTLYQNPTADGAHVEIITGGVLEQYVNGIRQPLAFFSKQLRPPEMRYSTFDRELLALYLAIRHFRFFLEGRPFTAYTDHKPLVGAISKLSDPWTAQQQRHLAFISEYSIDIRHVSGKSNVVADCLSRSSLSNVTLGIDYEAMAKAQEKDRDIKAFPTAITGLHIVPYQIHNSTLLCDVSTGLPRLLVPQTFQRQVFESIHNLAHPSRKSTVKLVSQRFVWHGLKKQVKRWSQECLACQQSKIQTHVHSPVLNIPVPSRRFSHLHIDLVGPLPPSEGFTHLLTIIDRTSRWPEVIPLSRTSSTDCAKALIRNWISRFGVPLDITSDRGTQFTSTLWGEIANQLGVQLHQTTAYHPQSNGLVERLHRTLKAALKAHLQGPNRADELPWILLGLRTAPKEDIGSSAAEIVYGTPLTVPGEFTDPSAKCVPSGIAHDSCYTNINNLSPLPTVHHNLSAQSYVPKSLRNSKFVFIRHDGHRGPLQRPYNGPFQVVAPGDKTFRVMVGDREEVISVDRMKPAHVDITSPVPVAQPPQRGRPLLQPAQSEPPETPEPEDTSSRPQARSTRSGRAARLPPRFQ
ncbi:Pol polyprotein [Plakobranchus ocellatus]|uniref:Pol polyprotein n=1 Tax=Plakobranchus ocellatus TaxID=259542 RepID=A0AAV4CIY8_9GAST|nr:Pol polyprotein [Plakobranchus ocellatus]